MNTVAWFEIPVEIFSRAKHFYSQVFDCQIPTQNIGSNFVGLLDFGQEQPVGAIIQGEGYIPSQSGALIYLNVGGSMDAVLERVGQKGGEILLAKTPMPDGRGSYAVIKDSEGNKLGLNTSE